MVVLSPVPCCYHNGSGMNTVFHNVSFIVYESPRGEIVEPKATLVFKVLIQINPWKTHTGIRGSFQARDKHFVRVRAQLPLPQPWTWRPRATHSPELCV